MDSSMRQKRAQGELGQRSLQGRFDSDRTKLVVDSLYAIAQADGHIGDEELAEIQAISAEFGLDDSGQGSSLPPA